MSFVAFLTIDGVSLSSTNDRVGAFVDGECRGTSNLIYVESKNRYYAYFNVFSNTIGETISFKVYDSGKDEVTDISRTIDFETNALYGNLSQAYSFANPALSSEAELIDFDFEDATVSNKLMNDDELVLYVANGLNLSALTGKFEVSNGARLVYKGKTLQSGVSVLDFSQPISIDVVSEDESVIQAYQVTVRYNTLISDVKCYKRDAVCYNGGAIKVTFSENGSDVFLLKDQTAYATLPITNGEAVFTDLAAGNYLVKINEVEKSITINLKE